MHNNKKVQLLGTVAAVVCVLMYVSYIPQIISNFSGNPVQPLQPLVAMINATLWVTYGWLLKPKSWPVIIANFPGVIFGLVTFVTVYIH
ncbi:SWEET family sugar transporter [Bombilactobacillus thymidiniphilus]|uniref:SWEET family sugar transporter n=1 Tax=Bombilactobacillus thymidiniphilus TaxID=2923363 RepID=A0ABY4PCB2_9LACO|nr:SWEET family sugar transporter [Bombilactobacillus thymidiniphilus]UQS83182.1 SWEET family sugar transporter [Bombilactobacillus thymidiniphilus]